MKRLSLLVLFVIILFAGNFLYGQEEFENEEGSSSPFSQTKFVPDIALILDASSVYRNIDNDVRRTMSVPGMIYRTQSNEEGHGAVNENIGFNFNYSELALYAAVDPYFELFGVFHLAADGFEIEEAYINSTSLPGGFGLKIGKFLSAIGRINSRHAHVWSFTDQPLIMKSFFGDDGLNEIGLQLVWIAPADFFLKTGVEVLQGENEASYGYDSFRDPSGNYYVKGSRGPNLYTGFLKTSFDVGDLTILYGIFGTYGHTRINYYVEDQNSFDLNIDELGTNGFGLKAETWIAGAELTCKYLIDSYRYISFQTEFLYRNMAGSYYLFVNTTTTQKSKLVKRQSGFYSQVVIKPFLLWRFGARIDLLNMNHVRYGGSSQHEPYNLFRTSAMIDFLPSEFSLFRLQYNYDGTGYTRFGEHRHNHEVILQVNVAIGAHGAHSF